MTLITSTSNPRISKLRELHTTRGRKKSGLFLMEGIHLLEVLLDAGMQPLEIYYEPGELQRTARGRELFARIVRHIPAGRLVEVSAQVMGKLGDVQHMLGVVSVLPFAEFEPGRVRKRRPDRPRPVLLVLDDLADPGNMGTIFRTALAADVDEVLLTPNCVDCYSPKVVRAAAGAHVALPVSIDLSWAEIAGKVALHCGDVARILLAQAGKGHVYYEQNLSMPFALIIGNEAHGLSREARSLATARISIPLENGVESLNAAIATGIILYEALRQARQAP